MWYIFRHDQLLFAGLDVHVVSGIVSLKEVWVQKAVCGHQSEYS